MPKSIRTNNIQQQNIVKMLNGLAGRYSRWVIWQDFITMAAISIANTMPHPSREKFEKNYLEIAAKYNADELNCFAKMLTEVVMSLEANPEQDFRGEHYIKHIPKLKPTPAKPSEPEIKIPEYVPVQRRRGAHGQGLNVDWAKYHVEIFTRLAKDEPLASIAKDLGILQGTLQYYVSRYK